YLSGVPCDNHCWVDQLIFFANTADIVIPCSTANAAIKRMLWVLRSNSHVTYHSLYEGFVTKQRYFVLTGVVKQARYSL
ncbi:MAG TPA: hypothetical protein VIH30_01855, partial [Aquirhabdus sp.]